MLDKVRIGIMVALALGHSGLGSANTAWGQETAFRYRPERAKAGVVLHYRKSNLDGTHPTTISVFVAGPLRLESFKWQRGGKEATLVTADLDPERLTITRFESRRVSAGGRPLGASLTAGPGPNQLTMEVGGRQTPAEITNWPWHSYDFDFAGLGLAMRHLVQPEGKAIIGIADVNFQEDLRFVDKGPVTIEFTGSKRWRGWKVREYSIDGPGLENQGGKLLIDRKSGFLAGFEIAAPDEPGMKSGLLVLERIEPMTAERWLEFQAQALAVPAK